MLRRVLIVLAVVAVSVVAVGLVLCARDDDGDVVAPLDTDQLVLVGTVTRIVDGDTIDVQLDSGPIRVRLDSIDAPERRQPWGAEATDALMRRLGNGKVEVSVVEQDRYDRLVATVYSDGLNVNAALIEQGHAWAYRAYLGDERLLALEEDARRARRGLWSLADPVPPWEWRRGAREPGDEFDDFDDFEAPGQDAAAPTFECGTKRRCGDMASCEEAGFFLRECGLPQLDADKDGIPCEALCR